MRGIDISHWQQGLDVGNILMDGLEFVILKITDGGAYTDQSAAFNYTKAKTAGIPAGGYCYSHAVNAPQARAEAAHILDTIMGFPMPLGLYLDVEEPEQLALPHDVLMNVLIAWCDAIRAAGYIPGVYGSEGTLWAKIRPEELPEDVLIWVAHYGKEPAIPCDIWQSSDRGVFPGYVGPVDVNEVQSDRFHRLVLEESAGDDTSTIEALCGIISEQAEIIKKQAAELERLRSLAKELEGKA